MKLPESLQFFRPGWWLLHAVSIGAVFGVGMFVSQHLAGDESHLAHGEHNEHAAHAEHKAHADEAAHGHAEHAAHAEDDAHAAHAAHGGHDHASPEVLRPLMQQMLVDSVQLQGALFQGELDRAATHAAAIAAACEDGGSEHGALPERLGPKFLEHDRDLHKSAGSLAEALRAGSREKAIALNQQMVSACQSCHAQAPAAKKVDLRVLTSFAETLTKAKAP